MNTQTKRGRVLCTLLLAAGVVGCDFISPTATNPNVVPEATVDQLFTGIQVNTFYFAESQIGRIAALWTQQMAGTDRQFAILDGYTFTEEDADGEFSSIYTGGGLIDLKQAITKAEDAGRQVYAGILKIHEAYMFGMAASIFGDIPYSEAATPGIDTPMLDDQAAVYTAVQTLLDDALTDLASGAGAGPGAIDVNFAGNATSWTAVAHSLKARLYMHWGEVNGATAYTAARDQALLGISTAAGTWKAYHTTASTEQNLWAQFMRDRSGYISAGDYLVPLMTGDSDPRLPYWFSNASGGGYAPRDSELSTVTSPLNGYGAIGFDFPILSCAENNFILAEAYYRLANEPNAIASAQAALACQESEWGVSLTAQKNAFTGLTGAALLTQIMNQKYIALFLNIETWNDYKRTCLPAITPKKVTGVPGRLYYGQGERQSNPNVPTPAQQPARNDNDPTAC